MVKHNNSRGRYRFFMATRNSSRQLIACLAVSAVMFAPSALKAQDTVRHLDEVMIQDARVSNTAPLTTSTVSRDELDDARTSVSLPFMLETQPSVVAAGENGMVGATTIRIRGVDGSRINVNINGIPLNDAESQEVFWYNIPNLGGMAQSVQLQRGVGASNGGSAAFGGAMNLQTLNTASRPYGTADIALGSFNTRQYGLLAGTGLTKHGFTFDAAYNGLTSDGFVRGGQTDQQSLFLNAGWYGERQLLKAIVIIGKQQSGITWDGASAEDLDADPHFNDRGKIKDQYGNVSYYPNETDNYWQQHYQLYYGYLLTDAWSLSTALDYTHGYGYTESYKRDKKIINYGFDTIARGFTRSDLITRKLMLNDAYTANLAAHYDAGKGLSLSFGGSYQFYDGEHYGNVIWLQADTSSANTLALSATNPFDQWYSNTGRKHDAVAFAKANYDMSEQLNLYLDLQLRRISYSLHGTDDDYGQIDYDTTHLFFNPKFGANYRIDDSQRIYAVAGIANREPARADIKEAIYYSRAIHPETMLDIEMGYQLQKNNFHIEGNLYAMLYKNQLVNNGLVTESGYALMENVDQSYRLGIELVGGCRINRHFSADANLTLSTNRIVDYVGDLSEYWGSATHNTYDFGSTQLALSPSVVGALLFTYRPCDNAKLQLIGKYVGRQYADNTGREESLLDPYFLLNLRASYTFTLNNENQIECQLALNNLLDVNYRTTAWCGTYYDPVTGSLSTDRGYYQQPGFNLMGRVIYRF